ncbi:hypothetical protein [Effusibacillus dendaii]|uniref:Uncharacterized protein n=1 Tax=Effusibacillus dendaii TaxID=2743772 RepID=A0A7I8D9H8_9BACL|nr:hypothetical protein [Effusibacillus dendaii]BCJ86798.1 hypothetical protein skT53_17830 [Effusibacillus dendaii]
MMSVFLFDIVAILVFVIWGDRKRLRELMPTVMTGIYFRFLQQYIIIDWLQYWEVHGTESMKTWLPIIADITVWPVVSYLFIQYCPKRFKLLYGAVWVCLMFLYKKGLEWLHIISMKPGWHEALGFFTLCLYFSILYFVWVWLQKRPIKMVQSG